MSDPITRQTLVDVIDPLKDDIQAVLRHLEQLNGRLRTAEQEIAVFKDRQPSRAGALAGSIAGAIIAGVTYLIEHALK